MTETERKNIELGLQFVGGRKSRSRIGSEICACITLVSIEPYF